MDRRRRGVTRKKAIAAFGFAVFITACSSEVAQVEPAPLSVEGISELRWVSAEADAVEALTQQPANCSTLVEGRHPVEAFPGEALFNSPLLLGGQAAKAGISCASCHRNGRDNPSFVFHGVSGAPGTADVSHGLFGKLRDDDQFNPVQIPDLALPEGKNLVDRNDPAAMAKFLRAQIVEEFDGPELSDQVVIDLSDYLMGLNADCSELPEQPVSWDAEIRRVREAYAQNDRYRNSDPVTAQAYIDAARAALGRLHARFAAPEHEDLRQDLAQWSRDLQAGQSRELFLRSYDDVRLDLETHAETSLYNRDVLRRALAAR